MKRDKVDTSIYLPGLADLWTKGGKRYGLPKDWDTIAIVVNKDIQKEAGVADAELAEPHLEPQGRRDLRRTSSPSSRSTRTATTASRPKFDPKNVVRYGMEIQHSDDRGQSQFSCLALSTGWYYTDGTFKANYHFDDPRFVQTIQWMLDMTKKGFICPYEATAPLQFHPLPRQEGRRDPRRLLDDRLLRQQRRLPRRLLQTPIGPVGRKSMTNGLADSIWAGSKHKEEAWRWVKYLASAEAETTVGTFGVVFPAVKAGVDNALAAYKAKNLDVSAFTDMATAKGVTFVYPVLDNGVKVQEIMTQAFDTIFLGKGEVGATLKAANAKVNALFK